MIVPLKIPPGAYQVGTEYQAKGRWRDVDRVRWRGVATHPIGGWSGLSTDTHSGFARGGIGWTDNSGNGWIAFGTAAAAYAMDDTGNLTDITPGALSSGSADGTTYASPATTWQWSVFGEIPIGCSDADGTLWEWDLNTANNLTQVNNSPTSCHGVHVTAERFVWALGDGGDPRSIRWSDRGDRTVWTAASTNQAGGFDLDTEGDIRFALNVRGETVIVTTRDVWVARYVGYPDVYDFRYVGPCTATSNLCGASTGDAAFWWGEGETFYIYQGGYVQELRCDVWEHLKDDAKEDTFSTVRSKVTSWHNNEHSELWWLYESDGATTDVDKYVAYDYTEGVWHFGECGATTIISRSPYGRPIGLHAPSADIYTEDFAADEGWTDASGHWAIAGGVAACTPDGSPGQFSSDAVAGLIEGATYVLTLTVSSMTAGELEIDLVGTGTADVSGTSTQGVNQDSNIITSNGTYSRMYVKGSVDPSIHLLNDGSFDGDVDDISISHATVYQHEVPTDLTASVSRDFGDHFTSTNVPSATTGPLEIGDGERRVHVTRIYPDEQDQGELQYTFSHREYPTASETTESAVTAANPTDVRFSGRQFTMKVEPVTASSDWRCGITRLEIHHGGKR